MSNTIKTLSALSLVFCLALAVPAHDAFARGGGGSRGGGRNGGGRNGGGTGSSNGGNNGGNTGGRSGRAPTPRQTVKNPVDYLVKKQRAQAAYELPDFIFDVRSRQLVDSRGEDRDEAIRRERERSADARRAQQTGAGLL